MASTYSKLKIELIGTGDQSGTWGTTTNNNLGSSSTYRGLEQAIVGMATLETADFTANSYTLPYTDSNDDQDFRCLVLNITATLSGQGTVIVPPIQKPYIVINDTASSHAVTVKVSGQTGISVPSGAKVLLYNNGTDVGTAITYLTSLTLGSALPVASGGTGVQTLTGIVKGSGTSNFSAAVAGTDYLAPPSGTAILKANSGGALANATAGTDYLAPPSGTAILKANSGGALANATAGTDYAPATSGTSILKGSGSGGFSNATAGTDYLAPPSGTAILKANSGGALANAAAGTDYAPATSGTSILKGNGSGGFSNATAGTDYAAATTGTSAQLLGSNGSGGFSNVTVGSGLTYSSGTLSSSGGSMVYPGAGIANSTGSAWGTSYTTTGSGTVVVLSAGNPTLTSDMTINGLSAGRGGNYASYTISNTNTTFGTEAFASANQYNLNNVAIGYRALKTDTDGIGNIAIGQNALLDNTGSAGSVAIGSAALRFSAAGAGNIGIGTQAMDNTEGTYNVAIGYNAGRDIGSTGSGGDNNTVVGPYAAVSSLTTGSANIVIGYQAAPSSTSVSNTITFGNSSITTLRCQVTTITSLSDARDKKDIQNIPAGLSFINRLRPVSFVWNMRDGGKVGVPEFGFIAQELQQVQKDAGITVPNLVMDDNPDKLEAGASTLIPVLVKAIQELSAELKVVKAELAALKG